MIFLLLSGKMVFFSPKIRYWAENERWSFSRNTWKYDFFCTCAQMLQKCCDGPLPKKIKDDLPPKKIHFKVIDILGWHSRKSSSDSLYFYGDLYRRFHTLLFREKTRKLWLLLQRIWLEIFYNEESSLLCTIQPSGVIFRGVLERKSRKLFVH